MLTLRSTDTGDSCSNSALVDQHRASAELLTKNDMSLDSARSDGVKAGDPHRRPSVMSRPQGVIAGLAGAAICVHLLLRFCLADKFEVFGLRRSDFPLVAALLFCGIPLVLSLAAKLVRREFSSDLLAGISIVTSVALGEYLAGTIVVLMLSGGQALEAYALRNASSVLEALAKRMPSLAHRQLGGEIRDVPLESVAIGETLLVFPNESCPVDGTVVHGSGVMDESYLTGEPFKISKVPGSAVLSGSINGETALTIRAEKRACDSRYAKIMQVMRASEQQRPRLRRMGDTLGAFYTPLSVALAAIAWAASGESKRFLAVLVVATPCPLIIAIPVAIIGSISFAARRGIIIKDPAVLERIATCTTAIFDKTGTLTYGQPRLTEILVAQGIVESDLLAQVASLERYSKHPLSTAIVDAARHGNQALRDVAEVSERPGEGLRGTVAEQFVQITSRKKCVAQRPDLANELPSTLGGLECVVLIDDHYAATMRFRDEPRADGAPFIQHLRPKHGFRRVLLVSGDRKSEVRYLADQLGIQNVYAGQSPEQKLEIVRRETERSDTLFLGDGINDAPALAAATVGIAFGQNSDIAAEAAGAVILDTSLQRVDELLHVSRRLRTIALQSAVGGMALSLVGMFIAAAGYLPPVAGAIVQEAVDVLAVLNALRVAVSPATRSDYLPTSQLLE